MNILSHCLLQVWKGTSDNLRVCVCVLVCEVRDYACVCMRSVFCVKVALRRQFVWETELFTLWAQG